MKNEWLIAFAICMLLLAHASASEIDTIDVYATQDSLPPSILDLTNKTGYSGQNHTFIANVTDNENGSGVKTVNLQYWYDDETNSTIVSMLSDNNITYQVNVTLDPTQNKIYYKIIAYDNVNNSNYVESNVTIVDILSPIISDIYVYPYIAAVNQTVNISCTVYDNIGIKNVTLICITTNETFQMNHSGNTYYKNLNFSIPGTYSFQINATDTSNNTAVSDQFALQIVQYGFGGIGQIIKVYVPKSGVIQGEHSFIMIKLVSMADGLPLSGFADKIKCFIVGPDGNYIIQNATPYELRDGIYICNFTAPRNITGNCVAWAIVYYTDNQRFVDANVFSIVWDYYSNVSRLTERIGDIIWLVHYESKNITDSVAFHIREQANRLIVSLPGKEEQSMQQKLLALSLNELYRFIFWSAVIFIVFSVAAILYGNRRAKKIASTVIQVVKAPEQLIEEQTKKKK